MNREAGLLGLVSKCRAAGLISLAIHAALAAQSGRCCKIALGYVVLEKQYYSVVLHSRAVQ